MEFLKKLKIELKIKIEHDPKIRLLGMYPKKQTHKHTTLKRYLHPTVHLSMIYNCQDMEEPKCSSTDEWIKVCVYIYMHTHNAILLSCKKQQNFATCSNMDGTAGHHAKWHVREK